SICAKDPRGVVKNEIFAEGTVPTEYCDMHEEVEICTETGLIATEHCPNTETRVFIRRDPPYNPADRGGIVPNDWDFNLPTETCDMHTRRGSRLDDIFDRLFPSDDDDNEDNRNNRGNDNNDSDNNNDGNGNGNNNGNN